MRTIWTFLLCIFLCIACSRPGEGSLACRLEHAQKKLAYWEAKVQMVQGEVHAQQIARIDTEVEKFEVEVAGVEHDQAALQELAEARLPGLFLKEREDLSGLIIASEGHESEAQIVLDRILRVITQVSQMRTR